MFICTVRVRPGEAPYSILIVFALCVMRLIVPSKTQSNRMLVIWQESRGSSDVGRFFSAAAAACPAAVNFTGGGNQPAGPSGIGSLPALIAAAWLIGTRPTRPPGGFARTCCSCAQSPARSGLPFDRRKDRFERLADLASLNC